MQIVVWLECLRLGHTTGLSIPLGDKRLFQTSESAKPSKKKKKRKSGVLPITHVVGHFEEAVGLLVDKLLIWSVGSGMGLGGEEDGDEGMWKGFILPVIVKQYGGGVCSLF